MVIILLKEAIFYDKNKSYKLMKKLLLCMRLNKLKISYVLTINQIIEWQNRPLSTIYPIVLIDAVRFSVRDNKIIRKLVAYVVLGMNQDGYK